MVASRGNENGLKISVIEAGTDKNKVNASPVL